MALEALLRLLPDWLAQLADFPIGVIIFVREDIARAALKANFNQFSDRYEPYALKWNWSEASALALWIAQQAGALDQNDSPSDVVDIDEEQRGRILAPIWGWKLGREDSNEARGQEWIMSSLSDFRGRLQARDLVRFLYKASKRSSSNDSFSEDRLLTPRAMRNAVDPCSEKHVEETSEENGRLKVIFSKIQQLEFHERELPWSYSDAIRRLEEEEIRMLEAAGVFFRDKDEYFVPEIYRSGLRLRYPGGARKRIVTLMRRARTRQK